MDWLGFRWNWNPHHQTADSSEQRRSPKQHSGTAVPLSSELMHICEQSHCGCRVYEKNIPIDYQTAVQAEEFNMNLTTCAMNGGEDYELLFTVPIGDHEKIETMEGVRQIGYITKENLGKFLITRDGQEFELKAQGWNPLKD